MSTEEDQNLAQIYSKLEERISGLERRIFGDEINSKIQQKRQVIDELIQINGQIQRSLANRESITQLMKSVEEILSLIQLEDTSNNASELLGCENKANAILLAEPIIRNMHELIRNINLENMNEAMNSSGIRDIISLKSELIQLKLKLFEELESPCIISLKIQNLTEAIDILITNSTI